MIGTLIAVGSIAILLFSKWALERDEENGRAEYARIADERRRKQQ